MNLGQKLRDAAKREGDKHGYPTFTAIVEAALREYAGLVTLECRVCRSIGACQCDPGPRRQQAIYVSPAQWDMCTSFAQGLLRNNTAELVRRCLAAAVAEGLRDYEAPVRGEKPLSAVEREIVRMGAHAAGSDRALAKRFHVYAGTVAAARKGTRKHVSAKVRAMVDTLRAEMLLVAPEVGIPPVRDLSKASA